MCDPVSISIASIAATVVGTGASIYGQMQSSAAASAAASYNAQVSANNQKLANQEAQDAIARGDQQAQLKASATEQVIGRQKAALAANGVDVNSGSAVDLESDSAAAGQFDQLTIQNNALRESIGYHNQGINYQNQASLDEASSANALSAGELQAGASVFKGAGSVAGQWYNFSYGTRQANPGYGVSPY